MKNSILSALGILCMLSSCSLFEADNYEAPAVELKGIVVDAQTGAPVLTDQGSEGIRVRLTELSWGDNVEHNPDFYCMPDGTFQNTKLFKGNYNITVDGPFIPLVRTDGDGKVLSDDSKNMELNGSHEIKMEVHPFLKVEWVGDPVVENGKIKAKVKVTRAVTEQFFRDKIEPLGNYNPDFLNVTDIQLFVSYSATVGYRARDERWSSKIEYNGDSFKTKLGQVIDIVSTGEIPKGRTVFVRAASRINYDTPRGTGNRRWNYNEAKRVDIP
ncbi:MULTISPECIES: DUF3823 domain-containing protein [Sphingobacterium]|uniref:Uncharacterized protein DUF3823 n=2 Tax=Sphingobacterium TaxID=28453 RepID=A0A420BJL5_SPHD1|nr:DUF3823 domain-containing protein [Sphingobacterium detergens]RKE56908.1 uncharacterized protein DUF3823 [Sphingobacterium detergens]